MVKIYINSVCKCILRRCEFKWIDLKSVLVDTIYFLRRFNNNKFLLSFISSNTYVIMYYIRVWSLMIMQIDCTSFTVIHSVYKLSCTKIMYLRIRARSMLSKFYRNQDSPWTNLKDTFTWLRALEQYHSETVLRYAFSREICSDPLNLFFNILKNFPHVSIFSSQIFRTIYKVHKLLRIFIIFFKLL